MRCAVTSKPTHPCRCAARFWRSARASRAHCGRARPNSAGLGAAIPEAYGGGGFGCLELAVIAEELGRCLAPVPFSSSVGLATEALLLAGSGAQKERYLPRLAQGKCTGTFALAETPGQSGLDGVRARVENGRLTGTKRPVLDGGLADFAVVVALESGRPVLVLADLSGSAVKRRPLASFDPSRPQAEIRFLETPVEGLGGGDPAAPLIERLLDGAAVLMAMEQLGGAARALEITRDFAVQRHAFGRPIGGFQAIKHRLADRWCDIELARSNAWYGAWALAQGIGRRTGGGGLHRAHRRLRCVHRNERRHGGNPRGHRVHLGSRLPPLLPSRPAAVGRSRQRCVLETPARRPDREGGGLRRGRNRVPDAYRHGLR